MLMPDTLAYVLCDRGHFLREFTQRQREFPRASTASRIARLAGGLVRPDGAAPVQPLKRRPALLCDCLWRLSCLRMTFNALEHRNVAEVDGMLERFVGLVAKLALVLLRQATEVDRV